MNPADIFKNAIMGTAQSTLAPGFSSLFNLGKSVAGAFAPPKQQYLGTMQPAAPAPAAAPQAAKTSSVGSNPAATTPKEAYVNSQVSTPTSNVNSNFSSQTPGSMGGSASTPPGNLTPTQASYHDAFNQYLQSLQPTSAETGAEKTLSELQLQAKRDNEKALGMGETLGFAAGEAQRVARNNQFGIEAASNALNSLTGARTARTNQTKARLDYEKSLMPDPSKQYTELSPGATLYDTQSRKALYTAPTTAGLNVGVGGGSGSGLADQVIANPALYKGLTPTMKGQVLRDLASKGYDTSSLTVPDLNAEQRQKIDDYDTLEREAQYASQLLSEGLNTGPIAGNVGAVQSTLGFNEPFTRYNSAISNLSSILLRARSGAAVTPQEYERIKGFIPRTTDDETTAQAKIVRFFEELQAAKSNYITRVTQTPQQIIQSDVPQSLNGGAADEDAEYQAYLQAIGQ